MIMTWIDLPPDAKILPTHVVNTAIYFYYTVMEYSVLIRACLIFQ